MSTTTELIINTYEELKTFRDNVNNETNTAKTVKLGADIDMNGDDWTPIGFNNGNGTIKTFSGTFDGQGHVISNMKINITAGIDNLYFGLFGYGESLYINNLILDNPIIYNSTNNFLYDDKKADYVSFLCGYNSQTTNAITNCRIINGHININNTGKYIDNILIGCICSFCIYSSTPNIYNITNCYVEVELNIKGNILPDFGGIARNNGFISNCGVKITGIIDLNLKRYPKAMVINGLTTLNNTTNSQVTNCYVHMNFTFNIYARLVTNSYNQVICGIGYRHYGSNKPNISNCYVISNIELNTSTQGATHYFTSSNAATAINCYSFINLSLRQYGNSNNTYINRNNETLQYSIVFANDTEKRGSVSYSGTYKESTTLEDDLQTGKLCYSLNNSSSSDVNFYQSLNFDKYPVLDNRHYIVNNPSTDTYTNTLNTNYIYDIWTYDDLMQFKAIVNTIVRVYENKDPVNLHRDFDLNGEKWTPILWFYGTFNGNGHKITNFYMDLADIYLISDTDSSYGLSFFAVAKVNDFSIETTIKGTYPKTTQLYLAALAYKGSCENVNVFVTYDKCNISITGLYDFYWAGICAIKFSDSDNSFKNCRLNMYLRNCNITFASDANFRSIYIFGLCYDCVANNSTVLLSINNTNTITNKMNTFISGISYVGNITQCNSYLNYYNIIPRISLGGILSVTDDNCTITSCYSFTSVYGSVNQFCNIGGLAATGEVKMTSSYSVFDCNITLKSSNCDIGGLTGTKYKASSDYITNCYADVSIRYNAQVSSDIYIGAIAPTSNVSTTAFYIATITYTNLKSNEYTSGTILTNSNAFNSGEVCYKLNNAIGSTVFYQSIGSNYYPTFNSNEWEVLYDSSQTPSYYNNFSSPNIMYVNNIQDLILFRNLINSGKKNIQSTVKLNVDIDMNGMDWIPIGTATNPFNGIFDGQNHKISNFKCYANNQLNQIGLFGNATNTIKDLIIDNIFIGEQINTNKESDFGTLVGCLKNPSTTLGVAVVNCYANNCKILIYELNSNYEFHIGGLIGNVSQSKIENCGIKNAIIDVYGGSYIGGLVGWGNDTGGTITNSYSEVDITFQMVNTNFGCILGGLCCNNFITEYCYSINTLKVTNLINGKVNGLNSLGKCNNCYVKTKIDVEINNPNYYVTSINGLCGYLNDNSQYNYIDATIAYNILNKTGQIKVSLNSEDRIYSYNYAINDRITNKGTISPSYTYQGTPYNQSILAYQFRNGYVCSNLNNNSILSSNQSPFYQTLYSDPYPVLDNTHQPVFSYETDYYNIIYSISSYDHVIIFNKILNSSYSYENETIEVFKDVDCNANQITTSTKEFKGTLEGNNYTISNFKLLTNQSYVGFINNNKGTIQNLRLSNVEINGPDIFTSDIRVGFICGYATAGNIINCHVRNGIFNIQKLSGGWEYFGGIVGHNNSSNTIISKCSSEFTITNLIGTGKLIYVGGIAGYNAYTFSKIEYCYSKITGTLQIDNTTVANKTMSYNFGGIAGRATTINNCYSVVDVEVLANLSAGSASICGIHAESSLPYAASNNYTNTNIKYYKSLSTSSLHIGYIIYDTSAYKSNIFAINNPLIQTGPYEYTNAYITDTYYTPITKHDFSDGTVCYGLNNNQSVNPVFYQRINLDEYPLLINNTSIVKQINGIYATAEIGITNYQELKGIATLTNAGSFTYSSVQLLNDIDMNNYVNGETWTPIGLNQKYPFNAPFNGNDFTIYNMIIDAHNKEYNGLFGYTKNTIKNVNIDKSCKIFINDTILYGTLYIGLLVGYCNSTIAYCNAKGYIDVITKSSGIQIGGLSCYSYSNIDYCNVETIITVEAIKSCRIGGLAEYHSASINNCNIHSQINVLNTTALSHYIGGICGLCSNNLFTNCFCDTRINIMDKYSTTFTSIDPILVGTTTSSNNIYSPGNLISINNEIKDINYNNTKKYTNISIDQIKNGYLCYNILNKNTDSEVTWKQNLREDYYPVLDMTHEIVYKLINNKVYINKKYNINSYDDFINFRNEINGITTNVTYSCDFYLNCNINLNNIDWVPINYNNYVTFSGTFYGNNHTINKLSLNHSTYRWTGLFGFCIGLKFKDLIISNSTISVIPKARGETNGASFLGYGITTIDNCHVIGSYFIVLNGFNTDANNEYYAGLGISLSGYQSRVVNCTNCFASLTYDITETTTRTKTTRIIISGLISNTVLSNNSSADSSYVENYFTNCKTDITINNFNMINTYCCFGGICDWFSYIKIENCNSNIITKNNTIQLKTEDSSVTFGLYFAGILSNLPASVRYNIQINKCYCDVDIDFSCINSYLCGIATTTSNNGATQTESITNCYSNMNIELTDSIRNDTNICGIAHYSNISNCYSILNCYFNKCTQSNSVNCTIGGISRYYISEYANIANCYSYLRVYGSIKDSTSKVTFDISGGAAYGYTILKSDIYSIPYTDAEIKNSLSGTYSLNNYCTTSYVTTITKDDFTNGKVCYGLNGDQTNINFYQYLKESNYPTLNSNYPKVLLKSSNYINPTTITEINNKYDLLVFRDSVNGGENYTNTTININADIDLDDMNWTPIDNINYAGILQGNGHTISNFKIQNQQYCGFFGRLYECEVHNLILDKVTIQGSFSKGNNNIYCGVLSGFERNINISNCNITNCKINISYYSSVTGTITAIYVGGLLGRAYVDNNNKGKINCNVTNTSIKVTFNSDILKCFVGGLFANNSLDSYNSQLINSSFNGNITIDNANGINTNFCYVSGLCISATDINSCYTINSINIINGRNINIVGVSGVNHTITNTYCKSIINVSSYTTVDFMSISGIAYANVSSSDINNVYTDNQIFYNIQTTDTTNIKIGQITSDDDNDVTVTNSKINIVPNQIINLGTTEATINDKVTGYNTIRKEDFNNGKVCYGLNTNGTYFYQIIGIDPYPILTNNNSTIKQLTISIYPSPLNEFYYNNDFDGNIYSYYDLCLFRNLVNSGTNFQGQTINLCCDIDMNGDEWIPIGCVIDYPFSGSFNGNNHVIKNMVLRLNLSLGTIITYQCIGLFGNVGNDDNQTNNVLIKDIIIDKTCQMKYNSYTGDIYCSYLVGRLWKGTIDNCKIYADVRLNNASNQIYYGSFAGEVISNNCIISNCYVNNNIVTNNMNTMLIFALATNTNTISNENTTKYLNNSCIINIRAINDIAIDSMSIIGLSRILIETEDFKETININNYVNNCMLINTTILNDVAPKKGLLIFYSIDQLNSNNYVNNDYPFIKNPPTNTQITIGSYDSEDFKSGKICYLLNGNQSNIKFYQNLLINVDIAPIPDNSHQQVYKSTTNNIDTYYNRPLNELPTQQLAVTIYNLANPTLLYNINISNNNLYSSIYYNDINFALNANNSFYSVTQSIEKYLYDIYHSSKNYKLESINLMYFKFQLINEIIKKKLTIGDVIMYNEIFAKLVNNLPIELVKTELNYYKRLCFYLRDKNALDTEHYNLIFGDE